MSVATPLLCHRGCGRQLGRVVAFEDPRVHVKHQFGTAVDKRFEGLFCVPIPMLRCRWCGEKYRVVVRGGNVVAEHISVGVGLTDLAALDMLAEDSPVV